MANIKGHWGWIIKIGLWTFFLSLFFSTISQTLMDGLGILGSLVLLLVIILLGIIFDIIGIAAAAAKLPPLNARAAKRVPGSRQAISLALNSDKVSNFCNDVVGDICGIISGAASAGIVFNMAANASYSNYLTILATAIVTCLTVGGKGIGKALAINYSTETLIAVGRLMAFGKKLVPFSKRT